MRSIHHNLCKEIQMPNIIIQRVVRTKRNKQVLFVDNTQYNNNNDMYKTFVNQLD